MSRTAERVDSGVTVGGSSIPCGKCHCLIFSLSHLKKGELKVHIPSFKKNKCGPDTREAPCMPCQDCFHWQTRDSSLVIIFSSLPMESQALIFPTRSSAAPTFYVVHRRSQMQVVFKPLHAETQKTIWGIRYSPSIASFVFYG